MKILITGSKGQLGSAVLALASRFPNLQIIGCDIDTCDITDREASEGYIADCRPQMIINAAAYTDVDKAEQEKEKAERINTRAVASLTQICSRRGIYLIHLSTDYVFDGSLTGRAYLETDTPRPLNYYGQTKYGGETVVLSYDRGMVLRTSWLFAREGHNFVNTLLNRAADGRSFKVVNDQRGCPTYAPDLASALLRIVSSTAQAPETFRNAVFHFANSGSCTRYEFACRIMQEAGLSNRVLPVATEQYPTPARRPHNSMLDNRLIQQVYRMDIPDWKDGLRRFFVCNQ